jgi:hypothetical protein
VLAEDPLDRDHVGRVRRDRGVERGGEEEQPLRQVGLGRGADHLDVHEPQRAAGGALDHADPAPGQPRVDTEHPHRSSSPHRTVVRHATEPRDRLPV